ncbi:MAG: hypothetical protein E6R13_00635 [Spirochaetes bacterium]|nr:MAG: hypothetical protein E6R13_00635 [Spirochaetota bacterium]
MEVYNIENQENKIRKIFESRFDHYANICLKIKNKNKDMMEVPFVKFRFNKAQWYIHKKIEEQRALKGYVRAIILKGRQQGCSTYVAGRYFWLVTHRFGCKVFILTHQSDATSNLFKMVYRFYENVPEIFCPPVTTRNATELIFGDLDSGYKVGTAGNKAVGRSDTIQLFHGSEVAFWENAEEHATGILETVPLRGKGTEVILESTANGIGNYFHDQWKIAETGIDTDFMPIFVPWFWQDEYRLDVEPGFKCNSEEEELKNIYGLDNNQINFRRQKINSFSTQGINGEKRFCREYPLNANEAFQATDTNSYIDSNTVMLARKCKTHALGHIIVGIDPARGEDRTSIAVRQGRVVHEVISRKTKDLGELISMAVEIIKKWNADKVFVDIIGVGAFIVDRLKELGFDMAEGVNAAGKALDKTKYVNKRAEMWGEMRIWLEDVPCQIPDIDSLHSDLCCVGIHRHTSNGALQMEKKDIIKSKHGSPDEADALALTFAKPVYEINSKRDRLMEEFSSRLVQKSQTLQNLRKNLIGHY